MISLRLTRSIYSSLYRSSSRTLISEHKDYIVVFPEKLNESPDHNEILRLPKSNQSEVDLSKITLEDAFKGTNQRLCSFRDSLAEIQDESTPLETSAGDLFMRIERELFPLDSAISILNALIMTSPHEFARSEIIDLIEKYFVSREERKYDRVKRILIKNYLSRRLELNSADKKMLEIFLPMRAFKLGAPSAKFDEAVIKTHSEQLRQSIRAYQSNLRIANQVFSHTIDDPDVLARISSETDDFQYSHHRDRTPLKITVATYPRFMQVCPDRFTRQVIWQAYKLRCSSKTTPSTDTTPLISRIRTSRRSITESMGFRNTFELKTKSSMARNKIEVIDTLKKINEYNQPKMEDQLRELNDFAADNDFEDPDKRGVQDYDVEYWSNKYMHDVLIDLSERDVKKLFPHVSVLAGVCDFFDKYFGIKIEEEKTRSKYLDDFLSKDAKLFEIYKAGDPIGRLIYYPHQITEPLRQVECTAIRLRSRCDSFDCLPLTMLKINVKKNLDTNDMSLRPVEVAEMFNLFANGIQGLLYKYKYHELNIDGCLETEARGVLPLVILGYLMNDYRVIQACSDNGNSSKIDTRTASKIIKSLAYFRPLRLWQELYRAHLDAELNSTTVEPNYIVKDIHRIYSPFARSEQDYDVYSMSDIIIGPDDGTYYSRVWSKLIANMCLSQNLSETNRDSSRLEFDREKILAFNQRLLEQLYDPNEYDTNKKLLLLTGSQFDPSKIEDMRWI